MVNVHTTSTLMLSPKLAREIINGRHMTQAHAAKRMGYSLSALNRFLNGDRGPSKRMARAFEGTFGSTAAMVATPQTTSRNSFWERFLATVIGNFLFWLIF